MKTVITIDGTAGAGKGTLGKRIADYFGFLFIDSGKSYRAVAALVMEKGKDPVEIAGALLSQDLDRPDLRSAEVTRLSKEVSKIPEVREAINASIKKMMERARGTVVDGRAGAYEFPNAQVKLFLSASPEERARRRALQNVLANEDSDYELILADIKERDRQDEEREVSPLKKHSEAVEIVTDGIDADEVFKRAMAVCELHLEALR